MYTNSQTNNNYILKINKAIDYIELNLENSTTLKDLANAAQFSKFHFNRIFSLLIGETPFQFVTRVRVEKAASLLHSHKKLSISEIALKCGFSDVAVFSKNFKKHFKTSATQYKRDKLKNSNNKQKLLLTKPYFCPHIQTVKWRINMILNKGVEVKELPEITVAYVRNIGPWNGDKNEYIKLRDQLFVWAKEKGLMFGKDFKYLILYHDDPNVALSDKLRMSLCITISPDVKVDGVIGKMKIEAAKYAICHFELTSQDFQQAWEWLYGQWLPSSGYQLDDKPYFETYPEEPKGEKFSVDFCIPVKPL